MKIVNKLKGKLKKINEFIKKYEKYINVYVIAIFFISMLYVVLNHELWRDEVQAWCLARDLNLIELVKQMQYEGHPCLWHLILMPFAKLGFPVITVSIISLIFVTCTVGIILYKAPFNYLTKILLILSSPFIYFYSIHGRVYCIIPFIISLICLVYPKRKEKPYLYAILLGFLMNTHIMMAALVGILSLLFFIETTFNKEHTKKEKEKYLKAIIIILLGVFICFAQINNSLLKNTIIDDIHTTSDYGFIEKLLIGVSEEILYFTGIYVDSNIILWVVLAIFIIGLIIGLKLSLKSSLIVLCSYGFQFIVCSFIWFTNAQRVSMFVIYIMLATWIAYHEKENTKKGNIKYCVWQITLILICIVSMPNAFQNLKFDIENEVSGAEETAKYIKENLKESKFICPIDYVATSITGYIDENIFWSNVRQDYFTFVNWDYYWRLEIKYDDFINNIKKYVLKNNNSYIIYSESFMFKYDEYIENMITDNYIQLIYISPEGLNSESYKIYKLTDEFYEYINKETIS